MSTSTTPAEILATVKGLRARMRKLSPLQKLTCHGQIARRRITDAVLFAERNTEHAEKCCWEARHHIDMAQG